MYGASHIYRRCRSYQPRTYSALSLRRISSCRAIEEGVAGVLLAVAAESSNKNMMIALTNNGDQL